MIARMLQAVLARIPVAAGAAIMLALLVEAGCALHYHRDRPWIRHPLLGGPALASPPRPGSVVGFDPVNLYAYRDSPLNEGLDARVGLRLPPKAPGERRVFLVGSSTVAGVRVPPGERISDHLQASLAREGRAAKVHNLGVSSYLSFHELQLIIGRLVHEKPDLVVLYDGYNDAFYGSLLKDWRPNVSDVALSLRRSFYEEIQRQMSLPERWEYFWSGATYAGWTLKRRREGDDGLPRGTGASARANADATAAEREAACAKPVELRRPPSDVFRDRAHVNDAAIDVFLLNVAVIADHLERRGVAFLHVLQPTPATKAKLYPCERNGLEMAEILFPGSREAIVETYRRMRDRIGKGEGAPRHFLDLSRATDDVDAYLYSDYVHEHRNGLLTKMIGDRIAARAAPLLH